MAEQLTTLAALIRSQAANIRDKPFLYFDDRVISYGELYRQVNRAANALKELGVKPGVGVSIMMPNAPEWLYVYYAVQTLGAYSVPINVALKGEGLRYIVDHSDSSLLICQAEYQQVVGDLVADLPKVKHLVINDSDASDAPSGDWLRLTELLQRSSDEDPWAEIEMGQISGIMYTSGTTGAPKGVVQRHRPANFAARGGLGPKLAEDDILYTCLPLFHSNALGLSVRRALTHGLPIAVSRRFSASRF